MLEWSNFEIEYLKKNFESKSYEDMAKELSRTKQSIKCKSHKLGLAKQPKYDCDFDFFKIIDNESKAYWFGFICADGYIMHNDKMRNHELGIQLHSKDTEHLKKFNIDIKGNYEVQQLEKTTFGEIRHLCSIRLYSQAIVHDLESHGIFQNKSLTIKFPKVDLHFLRHFIRGYFDGDGYLGFDEKKHLVRSKFTCGSQDFLKILQEHLTNIGVKTYLIPSGGAYDLGVTGINSHRTLLEYMYEDSNIYLARKYEKYIKYKVFLLPR